MNVNKSDYYYGAFYSNLIQKGIKPTLFDDCSDNRIIRFETNSSKYNIMIKYCINRNNNSNKWHFNFSSDEISKMNNNLRSDSKNLFIAICGCTDLTNTEIAAIDWNTAKIILGEDRINNGRRISIFSKPHSKHLYCYGTAVNDKNAIPIIRNHNNVIK